MAIADGATLWEVSKMLGHKDIRTTANQYGHLFPETQRDMAERMGRLILGEAPPAANKHWVVLHASATWSHTAATMFAYSIAA